MQNIKHISFLLVVLFSIGIVAQDLEKQKRIANSYMRNANDLYHQSKYADAEVAYKKSLATYPENPKAIYNLANAMMQQKRYKEAIKHYDYLAKNSKSNKIKAESYHNTGNANMGLNDYQKAVESYKNALRINPQDEETRYNLAYAQELLKQQQQQNKENKDQKDQDNKDQQNKDDKNQDQKDQDNKDQQNKNQEEKDKKDDQKKENDEKDKDKENKENKEEDKGDKKEDKNDEPKPKEQEEDEKKQQQPRPGKLTPQQAKQLLEALQNEEKKTQDKMNAKRIKGKPVKTEKDW